MDVLSSFNGTKNVEARYFHYFQMVTGMEVPLSED